MHSLPQIVMKSQYKEASPTLKQKSIYALSKLDLQPILRHVNRSKDIFLNESSRRSILTKKSSTLAPNKELHRQLIIRETPLQRKIQRLQLQAQHIDIKLQIINSKRNKNTDINGSESQLNLPYTEGTLDQHENSPSKFHSHFSQRTLNYTDNITNHVKRPNNKHVKSVFSFSKQIYERPPVIEHDVGVGHYTPNIQVVKSRLPCRTM